MQAHLRLRRLGTTRMDSRSVDLVPVDLATSKLRDEHRGIHRALLSGEIAELLEEPALHGFS
jgi:hypothetical protein